MLDNSIQLKFIKYTKYGDNYEVYYRIRKNFDTSTIFGKIKQFFFNICHYWTPIYCFDYPIQLKKWIYNRHPSEYWSSLLVSHNEIDSYANKFKTLEDIRKFEIKETKRLNEMTAISNHGRYPNYYIYGKNVQK